MDTKDYHLNLSTPETKEIQGLCDSMQVDTKQYVAFGWDREHIQLLEQMATKVLNQFAHLGMTHHSLHLILIDEISLTSLRKV